MLLMRRIGTKLVVAAGTALAATLVALIFVPPRPTAAEDTPAVGGIAQARTDPADSLPSITVHSA